VAAVHVKVTGRVQGIGFRWFARERARALDLAGWVRNLEDGAVELAAAGPAESLDRLLKLVSEGPPGAFVMNVEHLGPVREDSLTRPFSILR